MNKKKKFNQIAKDIKSIKIQGARNIARQALYAYNLIHTFSAKKKLLKLRPTEPMLVNVLNRLDSEPYKKILSHFDDAQKSINKEVLKIIKNGDKIFTHCHSTNVVNALIYSKKHGRRFEVINTETRPLFQGRKTAKELKKNGVKVTMFVDSASATAIKKENKEDKFYATKIFLGADAILRKGVINKIGSGMIAQIAEKYKVPLYIVADSWKYSSKDVPLEERDSHEVWKNAPSNIKIKNPSFEFIDKKFIRGIVSEIGTLSYSNFLRKVS